MSRRNDRVGQVMSAEQVERLDRRSLAYKLGIIVFSFAILVVVSIFYTNLVQHQSERKWCDLMVTLDDSYRPNYDKLTVPGKTVADQIHRLRGEFGCG